VAGGGFAKEEGSLYFLKKGEDRREKKKFGGRREKGNFRGDYSRGTPEGSISRSLPPGRKGSKGKKTRKKGGLNLLVSKAMKKECRKEGEWPPFRGGEVPGPKKKN